MAFKRSLYICSFLAIFAGAARADVEPVTIGVSLPLTGEASTYGVDIRNVFELANTELAGGKYKFIFEDDKCSGVEAVTAAQKLVNIDKVKYVLGPVCSGATAAAAPIYEKAKVVAIGQSSSPALAKAGDYIFRTFPNDELAGQKLADYVKPRHKNFAVMTEDTEFCRGLTEAFEKRIGSDVTLVKETFLPGSTDFRSSLLKLKGKKIDGIFLNSQAEKEFLNLVKQYRDLGITAPIYGAYWATGKSFLEKAGTLSEGIIAVDLPYLASTLNDKGSKLYQKYLERYGPMQTTEFVFVTTITSFDALHQAIESGGDVRSFLYSKKLSGVVDSFWFNADGDVQGFNVVMKQIKDGKPVPVE